MSEPISGAYETLITAELRDAIAGLPAERVLRRALEEDSAPEALARHLYFVIRRALALISEKSGHDLSLRRLEVSNQLLAAIESIVPGSLDHSEVIEVSGEPWLVGVSDPPGTTHGIASIVTPSIPLSESALLVNGRAQPRIGHEIRAELATTDDVSLLCSFVMVSGLRIVLDGLAGVVARGGRVRVLTTTYMGATQKKALDQLCAIGAEVRVSYSGDTTRLHAKAWLLDRRTGASTAYVGSSNLSSAAMVDGLEWNVRLSNREQPHLLETIRATFDNYWNDTDFEPYDPEQDGDRLTGALASAKQGTAEPLSVNFAHLEVSPRPFQQEVLDRLEAERTLFNRTKNLIVMATGTGKTVVAALDYKRLSRQIERSNLLFVAHRKEILGQSLTTFRTVLQSGTFGELLVDGKRPTEWNHVFASVQSLSEPESIPVDKNFYDVVIIDEFHHAAASTYRRILGHFSPRYLIGLTATPERADGEDILQWFDGHVAVDLRLWEAIDRQILVPFHYFGLNDNIDLEAAGVTWRRGSGYDIAQLDKVYTGNDARVALIIKELLEHVSDVGELCAIGFCVSMDHAEFMAQRFSQSGIPSAALTSRLSSSDRDLTLAALRNGQTKVIFAVDIFNEGVDVPQVNALLMLRPTESATIFLQQLGRGLRKCEGKSVLTVLDFVGNQNKNFRFDQKYGRLLGLTRRQLVEAVDDEFPTLPSGCHFHLDKVTKEQVLSRLKSVVRSSRKSLIADLKTLGSVSLSVFLDQLDLGVEDLYRNGLCYSFLQDEVRGKIGHRTALETSVAKAMGRMLHIDDEHRLSMWRDILRGVDRDFSDSELLMVGYTLFGSDVDLSEIGEYLAQLRSSDLAGEIFELLDILDKRRNRVVIQSDHANELAIHARYSRDEILAAFGVPNPASVREGVKWVKSQRADLAFVTINKSEKHFSPTTMYADTAISERLFQWESQSTTSADGKVGQRYIHHAEQGSSFHFFVRDFKTDPRTGNTMPYVYLGPASYVSHTGSRPMRIVWRMQEAIPADILVRSRVIAS